MCSTFASRNIIQISYISFEIARVAPINRQVCAITGGPRGKTTTTTTTTLGRKDASGRKSPGSRFTADLHFLGQALQVVTAVAATASATALVILVVVVVAA